MTPGRFGPGIDDAVIVPLVLAAYTAKRLGDAALRLLIHILDYAFPILLQLMRFPLFTLRIVGDGIAALLRGIAAWLPMSGARRERWREMVSQQWARVRAMISYSAFEEAVHHAFERGMAWVFRKCRSLTPGSALLVTFGALLWLPVSFGVATVMHAVLLAQATVLPAWMQLLHPLATVIAKSKLLVLPVFPAAWPQTRKHRLVQAMFELSNRIARLHAVQKTAYRYRQTRIAVRRSADAAERVASDIGLIEMVSAMLAAVSWLASRIGAPLRAAALRLAAWFGALPVIGPLLRRYGEHYDSVEHRHGAPISARAGAFFDRWSVKFTAAYYEARDNDRRPANPAAP